MNLEKHKKEKSYSHLSPPSSETCDDDDKPWWRW